MSPNPFKPPETDSTKNPRPPAGPGSPVRAVLTGAAVDICGSVLSGIAITVIYALQLHDQGLSPTELRDAVANMPHDSALYMTGLMLGLAMSLLGGYVCARIARRDEYRPGVAMAILSGVVGLALGGPVTFDEMTTLLVLSGFGCNLLGVKFGVDHNRRLEAPADAPAP